IAAVGPVMLFERGAMGHLQFGLVENVVVVLVELVENGTQRASELLEIDIAVLVPVEQRRIFGPVFLVAPRFFLVDLVAVQLAIGVLVERREIGPQARFHFGARHLPVLIGVIAEQLLYGGSRTARIGAHAARARIAVGITMHKRATGPTTQQQ